MRKKIESEEVKCDMCGTDITQWSISIIELQNRNWDLCQYCTDHVEKTLMLLTVTVGLHLPYKWIKKVTC